MCARLEHQMEARIAHDRSTLQQEFLHQTAEVQVRAAAAETAHAQLWEEHRLYTNEATAYQQHEQGELRRELRDAAEQHGLEVATVNSLRQLLERERALQETNLRHQAEEWRQHSEAITESATEEINYQRQELSAERLETNDLQQYLQDMLVELEDKNQTVEDWEEWYWNNYGQEGDGPEEQEEVQQHQPPLLQSQQAPRDQVPTTPCPAPATPPVLHGVVPSSLLPPPTLPNFAGARQPNNPPSEVTQPVVQQQVQQYDGGSPPQQATEATRMGEPRPPAAEQAQAAPGLPSGVGVSQSSRSYRST